MVKEIMLFLLIFCFTNDLSQTSLTMPGLLTEIRSVFGMDDVYEVFDIQTVAKSCIAGVLLQPNLSDDAGLPL